MIAPSIKYSVFALFASRYIVTSCEDDIVGRDILGNVTLPHAVVAADSAIPMAAPRCCMDIKDHLLADERLGQSQWSGSLSVESFHKYVGFNRHGLHMETVLIDRYWEWINRGGGDPFYVG
jgi:hypothetical protein